MTTLQKASIAAVAVLVVIAITTVAIRYGIPDKNSVPGPSQAVASAQPEQKDFPRASWKFAGYADPESGYQSMMWAMSQGNVDTTLNSLTPTARAKWERNMTRPRTEHGAQWAQRTKQTELFRILDKQIVSDTETHLQIESVGATNEDPIHQQWAKMIKVGSDWKFESWVGN